MKIYTSVVNAFKKFAIFPNIFSANGHSRLFEKDALIQYKEYKDCIADTLNLCNSALTLTSANTTDDAKQCNASFLFIPATITYPYTNCFMKTSSHSLKRLSLVMIMLTSALFFTQKSFSQGTMGKWEMCGL